MIEWKLLAIVAFVSAALSGLGAFGIQQLRINALVSKHEATVSKMDAAAADAQAVAVIEATNQTVARYAKRDGAIQEAQKRTLAAVADARRAELESAGLRSELTEARVQLSNSTDASVRDHAATLGVVFDSCVRSYLDMARTAQGHAIDTQTLLDSWPKDGVTRADKETAPQARPVP
jgi:hypothetical protein